MTTGPTNISSGQSVAAGQATLATESPTMQYPDSTSDDLVTSFHFPSVFRSVVSRTIVSEAPATLESTFYGRRTNISTASQALSTSVYSVTSTLLSTHVPSTISPSSASELIAISDNVTSTGSLHASPLSLLYTIPSTNATDITTTVRKLRLLSFHGQLSN